MRGGSLELEKARIVVAAVMASPCSFGRVFPPCTVERGTGFDAVREVVVTAFASGRRRLARLGRGFLESPGPGEADAIGVEVFRGRLARHPAGHVRVPHDEPNRRRL